MNQTQQQAGGRGGATYRVDTTGFEDLFGGGFSDFFNAIFGGAAGGAAAVLPAVQIAVRHRPPACDPEAVQPPAGWNKR